MPVGIDAVVPKLQSAVHAKLQGISGPQNHLKNMGM